VIIGTFDDNLILAYYSHEVDEEGAQPTPNPEVDSVRHSALRAMVRNATWGTPSLFGQKILPGRATSVPYDDGLLYYMSDDSMYFAAATAPHFPSKPAFKLLQALKAAYRLSTRNVEQKMRQLCFEYGSTLSFDDGTAKRVRQMQGHRQEHARLLSESSQQHSWRALLSGGFRQEQWCGSLKCYGCACITIVIILGIVALISYLKVMTFGAV